MAPSGSRGEGIVADMQDITKIYSALSNPYRRKIVELLRTKGRLGFKELHDTLQISVGALYHHLEMLEGIVGQDAEKKYVLTDEGRSALNALTVSEEKISATTIQTVQKESPMAKFANQFLFGKNLFNYLNRDPIRSFPLALIIVILGGWLSLQTNLEPVLMFYLNPASGLNRIWFVLLFPLGWLATAGVAELFSVGFYHRRGAELNLLNGTAFAMLPLLIVPSLLYIGQLTGAITVSGLTVITIIPVFIQAWIVCLLSASISVTKGLKIERTAVISLGVMYLNIIALIVALQLRVF